jgi:hypothetical protein
MGCSRRTIGGGPAGSQRVEVRRHRQRQPPLYAYVATGLATRS